MVFDYQKARHIMVENQLRPNKIKDLPILNIFKEIPKELYIPDELESLSYSDIDINLLDNRGYLKNLHIAQIIKHSEISQNHKILHIGALTGYVTSLLANLSSKVFAIETNANLKSILKTNLDKFNYQNVEVVEGSFENGFLSNAPYDRIIIDNPIEKIQNELLNQLSNDLGKIIFIKKENNYLSKCIKLTKNIEDFSEEYLFDVFSKYELYKGRKDFIF